MQSTTEAATPLFSDVHDAHQPTIRKKGSSGSSISGRMIDDAMVRFLEKMVSNKILPAACSEREVESGTSREKERRNNLKLGLNRKQRPSAEAVKSRIVFDCRYREKRGLAWLGSPKAPPTLSQLTHLHTSVVVCSSKTSST
jgi:hypothetical protein